MSQIAVSPVLRSDGASATLTVPGGQRLGSGVCHMSILCY